ncbi:MAG: DEAD/DEAH box helicase [Hyphomicrobiales bacterium]|nr:DEAD/DEAH box helicase [Hyphomicrobiales bacterium]MDE2114768.1 DEAD/DEAH box helicase [Hyphomicrobiales bacterium]
MAFTFTTKPTDEAALVVLTEKSLLKSPRIVPHQGWASVIGKSANRVLNALLDDGALRWQGDALFVPHETATKIPGALAEKIGFPSLAATSLSMRMDGRFDSLDAQIRINWSDGQHRSISPRRVGAFLVVGGKPMLLSAIYYELVDAVERFNNTNASIDARITAWVPIQDLLASKFGQSIKADGFVRTLTFYQAGAFSLDVVQGSNGPDFKPVLMSKSKAPSLEDEAPAVEVTNGEDIAETSSSALRDQSADALLPPALQRRFEEVISPEGPTRDAYVLGRNVFVVLPPEMKTALDIVQIKRRASAEERHQFLRNPRAAINDALSSAGIESSQLFVETAQYSDRVEGLGVWEKIDRLQAPGKISWLPESFPNQKAPPPDIITPSNVEEAELALKKARAEGRESVNFAGVDTPLEIFDAAILRVVADKSIGEKESPKSHQSSPEEAPQKIGLVVKSNIAGVEYNIPLRERTAFVAGDFPHERMGKNKPKKHQTVGFNWLVEAWLKGWPGVLLADDMGLGKTYQALAFLAWIKANLEARGRHYPTEAALGPILVVAPTALLKNWRAEAQIHLSPDSLGDPVEAFGSNLKKLKRSKDNPEEALDIEMLRQASWILTTYETMADYHRALARIAYSVVVFDEIQKIKEPGSINTRSAKTLNADFVLGLTGTPVENKIEDLWSIFDRIAPGFLGSLRGFSKAYGGEDATALKQLKATLDQPSQAVPAPMLRRMKDKARDGLPEKYIKHYPTEMPPEQAIAYTKIVESARGETSRQSMLETIHKMRGVSLHPERADGVDTSNLVSIRKWIGKSARLTRATEILKDIEIAGEKVIVFVEDLAVQSAFAEGIAALFDLPRVPAIINGGIAGEKRQEIVEKFQKSGPGFSLLVLSPKAAGVGLTITAANHVIHLSRWWNPAVEDQCNDRAYRIGATRDVYVHIPMAIHPKLGEDSFDEKLDLLLARKRTLSRDMLAPPESNEDLASLYNQTVRGGAN